MPEASETSCAIDERKRRWRTSLVGPTLPVHLGELAGEPVAETGADLVRPAAAHARDGRLRVRLCAAPAAADAAALSAVEPFVAERAERRATRGEFGQVVRALGYRAEPDEHLAAVLHRLAPGRLASDRVAAPA